MSWLGNWKYRRKIIIDHDDVGATLSHFPVLVYLSSSSGIGGDDVTSIFDELGASSKKIAVTKDDGTTQLYAEIEKWDSTNEKAWLWVSLSGWDISDTADTDIYIYYDNSKADNDTYIGDQGLSGRDGARENVWDSHFMMVQHMSDAPSGWTRDSNPVYHPDANNYGPAIVKDPDDGTFHMWYNDTSANTRNILHATAPTIAGPWTEDVADNPVLTIGGEDDWDEYGGWSKWVLQDIETGEAVQVDGKYWMFYDGATPTGKRKIGIATTTDLNGTWTRDTTNSPCLEEGSAEDWDDEGIGQIGLCVVKDGNTYKMLYTGNDGSGNRSIGLATSSNLIDWTKEGTNPVLSKVADTWEHGLETPSIWLSGGTYIVLYAGWTSVGLEQLGLATGSSLTSLTKRPYNPIASPKDAWESGGISDCCLFRDTDKDYILYEGENGYYAIGRIWCDNILTAVEVEERIIDSTSHDNDGTGYGTLNYQQTGKIGHAIDFPGSDDYFRVADDSSIEPQLITLEAWHYSDTLHNGGMMDKDLGVGYRLAHRDPGDNDYFCMFDGNAGFTVGTYTATTWTYAVTTYDGTTGLLYKNAGTPESLISADAITYSTGDLYIGANSDLGYDFNGKLDELRISDCVRSAAWIKATYESERDHFVTYGIEETLPVRVPRPTAAVGNPYMF